MADTLVEDLRAAVDMAYQPLIAIEAELRSSNVDEERAQELAATIWSVVEALRAIQRGMDS